VAVPFLYHRSYNIAIAGVASLKKRVV
jgi:hypothetical protein